MFLFFFLNLMRLYIPYISKNYNSEQIFSHFQNPCGIMYVDLKLSRKTITSIGETHMRGLLAQKDQRQLEILEYLFEKPDWIHLDELAEILDTNTRILKSDIKELREALNDFDIQSSTAGIRLTNDKGLGIEHIYSHFLKTSTNFQVLEAFFLLDAPFTYEHLAEKLDISLPSLRKKVAEINNLLHSNYRFKLKVTPISIIGDERDIRFFFAQYFYETYGYYEWPFSESKEALEEFVAFFIKTTGFPANYANVFQIRTLVAVNLQRLKTGNLNNFPNKPHSEVPIYAQLPSIQEELQPISEILGITIDPTTLEQLFDAYTQTGLYFTVEDLLAARETDELANRSYHAARDILDNLTRQFGIHFENTDRLVWHIHNTALLERQEINSESIISHDRAYSLNKLQTIFPDFYEAAVFEMMRYKSTLGQKDHIHTVVHLVYTLFTHADNLIPQLLESQNKVRVLVLSSFDFAHPYSLISLYKYHTSKNIQYEVWDKDTLNVDEVMEADYDAILTNFDVEGLAHPKLINISRMSNLQIINELNTLSLTKL